MNERFKALAAQSGFGPTANPYERQAFDVKMFAELIVKECADVCERFGESGDGYTCASEILNYFEVDNENS